MADACAAMGAAVNGSRGDDAALLHGLRDAVAVYYNYSIGRSTPQPRCFSLAARGPCFGCTSEHADGERRGGPGADLNSDVKVPRRRDVFFPIAGRGSVIASRHNCTVMGLYSYGRWRPLDPS